MTRRILGFLAAAALLALAGCGAPCAKHDGSVDGYCNGTVATNCVSTCADCIDEWKIQACPSACQVVEAKPADGVLPAGEPHIDKPAKWAVCTTP